ncbi:MAG TPA: hypothetical protein VIK55_04920 [Paludibacter sp.]
MVDNLNQRIKKLLDYRKSLGSDMFGLTENSEKQKSVKVNPPYKLQSLFGQTWNPEIIISTFIVIFISQSLSYVQNVLSYWFSEIGIFYNYPIILKYVFISPFYILLLFFLLHIILRAYWLGLIGLQYSYPKLLERELKNDVLYVDNNIVTKKIKIIFNNLFTDVDNNDLQEVNKSNIKELLTLKLDKICSALFSWSFVAVFLFLGLSSFLIVTTYLTVYFDSETISLFSVFLLFNYSFSIISFALFSLLTFLITYFLPRSIKKWVRFQIMNFINIVLLLFEFIFEILTLQFLFIPIKERIVNIFGTTRFKLLYILGYMLVVSTLFVQVLSNNMPFRYITYDNEVFEYGKYENLKQNNTPSTIVSLNSDVVSDFLKIKIIIRLNREFNFELSSTRRNEMINSYMGRIEICLNDSSIINPKLFLSKESLTDISTSAYANLNVRFLQEGLNYLIITYPCELTTSIDNIYSNQRTEKIPFWVN